MRLDKLTTLLQQALGDAQSLALAADHPYIEPAHLLKALMQQDDGPRSLLQRAGVNVRAVDDAVESALSRIAKVEGAQLQPGRDLATLLQGAEKEANKHGDQFVASSTISLATNSPTTKPTLARRYTTPASPARRWTAPLKPSVEAKKWTTQKPKASAKR
jgi:ATP-dependent Clp protease ATP-binding subunit ClpB